MTRIIGGVAGGRTIAVPRGAATRPTTDRVREALFSSVESALGTLRGRTFLDVYAGSGAVGLEAASRGAERVLFLESDRSTAALIRSNADGLGLGGITVIVGLAAAVAKTPAPEAADVAFLDPPYATDADQAGGVLQGLAESGWLALGALTVVERGRRDGWRWPLGFTAQRTRAYGDTQLWYGSWTGRGAWPVPDTRADPSVQARQEDQ